MLAHSVHTTSWPPYTRARWVITRTAIPGKIPGAIPAKELFLHTGTWRCRCSPRHGRVNAVALGGGDAKQHQTQRDLQQQQRATESSGFRQISVIRTRGRSAESTTGESTQCQNSRSVLSSVILIPTVRGARRAPGDGMRNRANAYFTLATQIRLLRSCAFSDVFTAALRNVMQCNAGHAYQHAREQHAALRPGLGATRTADQQRVPTAEPFRSARLNPGRRPPTRCSRGRRGEWTRARLASSAGPCRAAWRGVAGSSSQCGAHCPGRQQRRRCQSWPRTLRPHRKP